MAGPLNAKIVIARCSKNQKSFGIRIEQRGRDWVRTWAFPLDERKAAREGYSASSSVTLSGADDDYPGCPHCGSGGIVLCGCEKIGCAGGIRSYTDYEEYTCPWCNEEIELQLADSVDVSGGGY